MSTNRTMDLHRPFGLTRSTSYVCVERTRPMMINLGWATATKLQTKLVDGRVAGHLGAAVGLKTLSIHVRPSTLWNVTTSLSDPPPSHSWNTSPPPLGTPSPSWNTPSPSWNTPSPTQNTPPPLGTPPPPLGTPPLPLSEPPPLSDPPPPLRLNGRKRVT